MVRYILPHLYLFFGILIFLLTGNSLPKGVFYWSLNIGSILLIIIGLVWIIILFFNKKNRVY